MEAKATVAELVAKVHSNIDSIHRTVESLSFTVVHDAVLDRLAQEREEQIRVLQKNFGDMLRELQSKREEERRDLEEKRHKEREQVEEWRRQELEEIMIRRAREDEEFSKKIAAEDSERERIIAEEDNESERELKIQEYDVDDMIEREIERLEDEMEKKVEQGRKALKELDENRRRINAEIEAALNAQTIIPAITFRSRRAKTISLPGKNVESTGDSTTSERTFRERCQKAKSMGDIPTEIGGKEDGYDVQQRIFSSIEDINYVLPEPTTISTIDEANIATVEEELQPMINISQEVLALKETETIEQPDYNNSEHLPNNTMGDLPTEASQNTKPQICVRLTPEENEKVEVIVNREQECDSVDLRIETQGYKHNILVQDIVKEGVDEAFASETENLENLEAIEVKEYAPAATKKVSVMEVKKFVLEEGLPDVFVEPVAKFTGKSEIEAKFKFAIQDQQIKEINTQSVPTVPTVPASALLDTDILSKIVESTPSLDGNVGDEVVGKRVAQKPEEQQDIMKDSKPLVQRYMIDEDSKDSDSKSAGAGINVESLNSPDLSAVDSKEMEIVDRGPFSALTETPAIAPTTSTDIASAVSDQDDINLFSKNQVTATANTLTQFTLVHNQALFLPVDGLEGKSSNFQSEPTSTLVTDYTDDKILSSTLVVLPDSPVLASTTSGLTKMNNLDVEPVFVLKGNSSLVKDPNVESVTESIEVSNYDLFCAEDQIYLETAKAIAEPDEMTLRSAEATQVITNVLIVSEQEETATRSPELLHIKEATSEESHIRPAVHESLASGDNIVDKSKESLAEDIEQCVNDTPQDFNNSKIESGQISHRSEASRLIPQSPILGQVQTISTTAIESEIRSWSSSEKHDEGLASTETSSSAGGPKEDILSEAQRSGEKSLDFDTQRRPATTKSTDDDSNDLSQSFSRLTTTKGTKSVEVVGNTTLKYETPPVQVLEEFAVQTMFKPELDHAHSPSSTRLDPLTEIPSQKQLKFRKTISRDVAVLESLSCSAGCSPLINEHIQSSQDLMVDSVPISEDAQTIPVCERSTGNNIRDFGKEELEEVELQNYEDIAKAEEKITPSASCEKTVDVISKGEDCLYIAQPSMSAVHEVLILVGKPTYEHQDLFDPPVVFQAIAEEGREQSLLFEQSLRIEAQDSDLPLMDQHSQEKQLCEPTVIPNSLEVDTSFEKHQTFDAYIPKQTRDDRNSEQSSSSHYTFTEDIQAMRDIHAAENRKSIVSTKGEIRKMTSDTQTEVSVKSIQIGQDGYNGADAQFIRQEVVLESATVISNGSVSVQGKANPADETLTSEADALGKSVEIEKGHIQEAVKEISNPEIHLTSCSVPETEPVTNHSHIIHSVETGSFGSKDILSRFPSEEVQVIGATALQNLVICPTGLSDKVQHPAGPVEGLKIPESPVLLDRSIVANSASTVASTKENKDSTPYSQDHSSEQSLLSTPSSEPRVPDDVPMPTTQKTILKSMESPKFIKTQDRRSKSVHFRDPPLNSDTKIVYLPPDIDVTDDYVGDDVLDDVLTSITSSRSNLPDPNERMRADSETIPHNTVTVRRLSVEYRYMAPLVEGEVTEVEIEQQRGTVSYLTDYQQKHPKSPINAVSAKDLIHDHGDDDYDEDEDEDEHDSHGDAIDSHRTHHDQGDKQGLLCEYKSFHEEVSGQAVEKSREVEPLQEPARLALDFKRNSIVSTINSDVPFTTSNSDKEAQDYEFVSPHTRPLAGEKDFKSISERTHNLGQVTTDEAQLYGTRDYDQPKSKFNSDTEKDTVPAYAHSDSSSTDVELSEVPSPLREHLDDEPMITAWQDPAQNGVDEEPSGFKAVASPIRVEYDLYDAHIHSNYFSPQVTHATLPEHNSQGIDTNSNSEPLKFSTPNSSLMTQAPELLEQIKGSVGHPSASSLDLPPLLCQPVTAMAKPSTTTSITTSTSTSVFQRARSIFESSQPGASTSAPLPRPLSGFFAPRSAHTPITPSPIIKRRPQSLNMSKSPSHVAEYKEVDGEFPNPIIVPRSLDGDGRAPSPVYTIPTPVPMPKSHQPQGSETSRTSFLGGWQRLVGTGTEKIMAVEGNLHRVMRKESLTPKVDKNEYNPLLMTYGDSPYEGQGYPAVDAR